LGPPERGVDYCLSLMRALGVVGLGVVGIAVVFPVGDFVDEGVFVGDPGCKLLICDITKSPSMFDARSSHGLRPRRRDCAPDMCQSCLALTS
jgi:hypothetical protein